MADDDPLDPELLRALRAPDVSPRVAAYVLANLEMPQPRRSWLWLWRVLLGGAAVCYLLIVLTLGYATLRPAAPPMLAPRICLYWAGVVNQPGPLDGGL